MPAKLVAKQTAVAGELERIEAQFIAGAGQIAVSLLGMFNRVCGQIYAQLFLSPEPLSLDDIVNDLKVSKGNVSINIRILEDYKLVRRVWVKGTRRDYYEAVRELPIQVLREFFTKIRRNIRDSKDMVGDCQNVLAGLKLQVGHADHDQALFMREQLDRIHAFYAAADLLFDRLYQGETVDTSILRHILVE